ncbi:hypothetical protein ASPTUDRAFT_126847 [Aspergillus tubingensis CBS 134.48]|uniref:DSBA-like thioredoxin domain-containing protein n=1 Tax=Aspergillus tubingensis (strain CBS 134.48) TaxID=767770 RepID=A0A1L9MZE9_ASPTC|nr:hypothetical protein ASPTUDRAFT_126847 [Aspergillus tubingensis CBS 134.48]
MTNFNIQIISDTVCPWCYVGYRRLTRAITTHKATHPADTFTLTWHAFYLNPNSPSFPGLDKTEYYKSKFGGDRALAIFDRLGAVGQSEGIKFSFGGRTGNTRDSHRLMWYAGQKEKEKKDTRVAEELFRAYFEEEKNVTDREVLVQAGVGAGLERSEVERLLDGEEGGKEVDLEAEKARRQLVTGVPYYMVQGQYAVEGADEPETFLEVFKQVKKSS